MHPGVVVWLAIWGTGLAFLFVRQLSSYFAKHGLPKPRQKETKHVPEKAPQTPSTFQYATRIKSEFEERLRVAELAPTDRERDLLREDAKQWFLREMRSLIR